MKSVAIFAVLFLYIDISSSHVSLVFPPSRNPSYDFLDNVRTGGPCGVPYPGDSDAVFTTFATGSTIDIRFHLAYPHRGGILINILMNNGTLLHKLFNDWNMQNDTTSTSIQVTLPQGFTCDKCVLQLLRQAGEWVATGGYVFWTCADISIKNNDVCNDGDCSGNGDCVNNVCQCDRLYSGDFCQFKDDCMDASDCYDHGSCFNVSSVKFPRRQCFCNAGWHGKLCEKESSLTDVAVNESLYTIRRKFGNRLNVMSRLVNNSQEIEIVLSVNATGYVALGQRPPGLDSNCRSDAPGAFAIGANSAWPNGEIANVLNISAVFNDGGSQEEEEEEEEEQEEENEEEEGEEEEEEEEGGGTLHPMDCTDIVIGAARGSQYRILDYYTRDRSTPMLDEDAYGGRQDLTGAIGKEENGVTTIKFRRRLRTGDDSGDHDISDETTQVIWSFGQIYPDYNHNPGSGIEAGTAKNNMFYQPDEIKYHGNNNRGTASINFFLADSENTENCDGTYSNCAGDDCDYTASWSVKGDYIQFNVTGRVTVNQWVAIGFSDNTMMADTDVVVGAATDDGRSMIQDRWSTAVGVMPRLDSTNNLESTSVTREDGRTTISFIRPLNTRDSTDDISLTDDRFFVYTFGGAFDYTTGNIGRHPATPVVSSSRIILPSTCSGSHFEGSRGSAPLMATAMSLIVLSVLSLIVMMINE